MDLIDPDNNHYNQYTVNFSSHTVDSFTRDSNLNNNALNIFHNNARSIMKDGKLSEYEMFFKAINNPFKILIFTETWLPNVSKTCANFRVFRPYICLDQQT